MKIKSILNNSALIALNESKEEIILVGKGISFNKHPNDEVDTSKIEKVFKMSTSKSVELLELVNSVPEKYFDLTATIVRYASKKLGKDLDKSIYITMTDHINSAIERYHDNILLNYGMLNEMKQLFPEEFDVARWALDYINAACEVDLPEDECGFLSIHIISAVEHKEDVSFAKKVMKIVKDISDTVVEYYGDIIDQSGLYYSRFITHLKYLAIRYLNQIDTNEEDIVFTLNKDAEDSVNDCIKKIDTMMREKYNNVLSTYEKRYLVLHLCRLIKTK